MVLGLFLQIMLGILLLGSIILIFKYSKNKKYKRTKDATYDAVIHSLELISGLMIIGYVIGKGYGVPVLIALDDWALVIALVLAGYLMVTDAWDKIKESI